MINNLSKKERLLISIVIIIGVFCLYLNFIFIPSITSIIDKTATIDDYNKQIQNIQDTKKKNEKLILDFNTLKIEFDRTSKQLPYSERIPEITRNIKPLIDNSGVTFGPMSVGKPAEFIFTVPAKEVKKDKKDNKDSKVKLMSIALKLTTTGTYPNLIKLIDSIEKVEAENRIATIDNVTFSPSPTAVQANIGLRYYFLSNSKENDLNYEFANNGVFGKEDPFK